MQDTVRQTASFHPLFCSFTGSTLLLFSVSPGDRSESRPPRRFSSAPPTGGAETQARRTCKQKKPEPLKTKTQETKQNKSSPKQKGPPEHDKDPAPCTHARAWAHARMPRGRERKLGQTELWCCVRPSEPRIVRISFPSKKRMQP